MSLLVWECECFSGVAVAAGLKYKAATNTMAAVLAMNNGGPDLFLEKEPMINKRNR